MPRKAASPKPVEIDRPRVPIVLAIVAFIGVSLTIGAILWGRSDTGAIDVSATIANSQYAADTLEAGGSPVGAPAQEYVDLPNGGLQPQGADVVPAPTPEPPPSEISSSTATTTEDGSNPETTSSNEDTSTETTDTDTTEPDSAQPETSPETDTTSAPAGG